jgi:hypothetical protein
MRSLMFWVLSAMTLILASVSEVSAQGPPCKPDCFGDNWTNPAATTVLTVNGCQVTVKYRTRFACNQYYDVYIESVDVTGVDCAGVVPNWSTFLHQVSLALMLSNPMNFPPSSNGECEDNWRISKGTCWAVDFANSVGEFGGTRTMLLPCSNQNCCLERFQVCLSSSGVRTVTFQGSDPQPCPAGTPGICFPVCNAGGR